MVRTLAGTAFRRTDACPAESYRGLLERCVLDREVDGRQIGLGELTLAAVTPMRVGKWLADLRRTGLSASRIRKAYRVLSLAMDAAVRDRMLSASPCGKHHRLPSDGVLEAARRLGHSRSSFTTRRYARPLAGGDRVVADRLDQARKEAWRGSKPEETDVDMAPVWHEAHEQADRAVAPEREKNR